MQNLGKRIISNLQGCEATRGCAHACTCVHAAKKVVRLDTLGCATRSPVRGCMERQVLIFAKLHSANGIRVVRFATANISEAIRRDATPSLQTKR